MARLIFILAVFFAVPATAQAADPVTNTNNSGPGSLRNALATAVNGDSIGVPAGTYRLSSELVLNQSLSNVTIDGAEANTTVITGQGAVRVFHVTAGGPVTLEDLTISGGRVTGNGAGILHDGAGDLELNQIAVVDNVANATGHSANGGGGLYHGTATSLDIADSTFARNVATVAGTNSGGAGIFVNGTGATIANSTISSNQLNVAGSATSSGGGGYYADDGGGSMNNVTITQNTAQGLPGGGIFNTPFVGGVQLSNTIVANNSSNCSGTITSNGSNLENTDTCNLGATGDLPNTPSPLGPLEDNGGTTPTHRLAPENPAIEAGDNNTCEPEDQRGLSRPQGPDCDIGAVEFEGSAQASVPPCSQTGAIPVALAATPTHQVESVQYKQANGPTQIIPIPEMGGQAQRTVAFPEGRLSFEYWGDFTNDGDDGQLGHRFTNVLVDKTKPRVAVTNPNRFRTFVIRRAVRVDVDAADPLSGLVTDPSGLQRINTARRGRRTFGPVAADLCTNQATAAFRYRVLAPRLGTRTVLERVSGGVRVLPRRSGSAVASQKGQRFSPVRQPRELPIGSRVDTRRGTARLTSSRNTRSAIQDGRFLGGVFQVIQSRKRRAKGLTELRLKGSSFRRCGIGTRRKGAAAAQRRVIRRLRGNTRGRFRTRGSHSAATVRGTRWIVEDRCDGTLTRVLRGRVAVRDFRRKKTIVVRAGKSYLARARR